MRNLIQEACQGPVREAITQFEAEVANLSESDLRPVNLKDFQVTWLEVHRYNSACVGNREYV